MTEVAVPAVGCVLRGASIGGGDFGSPSPGWLPEGSAHRRGLNMRGRASPAQPGMLDSVSLWVRRRRFRGRTRFFATAISA